MYFPTLNSYFSGGGLGDIGFHNAGIRVQQSLELDPVAAQTLRKNFDHTVIEEDISKVTAFEQFSADLHAFSYPCPFYSMASAINGSKTTRVKGDELFLHAFRMAALLQPEGFVVENVPRMKAFPVVMECFEKLPGYYTQIFCPVNAKEWLPQDRKRLILIATKRRFPISAPTGTRPITLAEIIEEAPDYDVPNYVRYRMEGKYRDKPVVCDPLGEKGRTIAPTCLANYGKAKGQRVVIDRSHPLGYRPFTVREYARLQGVPDSFEFCGSEREQYSQIGNGIPTYLAEWVGREFVRYFN